MSLIGETKAKLEAQAREHGLLETPPGDSAKKPQIKLPADNRQVGRFARETGEIIGKTLTLFRRDLMPVTINEEKKRLDKMTPPHFRAWAEDHVTFFKEKRGDDDELRRVVRSMNPEASLVTLESRSFLFQLPEINRLNPVRMPVIRKNGQIELLPCGFWKERGIYTLDDKIPYDEEMTGEHGAAILRDCFSEYPLDARSLAAQIAAMLTTYCACMIPAHSRPPCFIYTANAPRAGKSMLAKFPNITLYGSAATRTLPRYDEARKVLDIIAMQADTYVIFDNIRGRISGEEIEAFLAAPIWEARPLGESTKIRVKNECVVFFTGNQLERSQDMADRALFIELLVKEVDWRDRKFTRTIDDSWIAENRGKIRSALWAIVRQWDADGRPPKTGLMAGFEAWSRTVPPIVANAGFGDCLAKPQIKGQSDEAEDFALLIRELALPAIAAARDSGQLPSAKYDFEDLMEIVKSLGLFENEEVRGGRRDVDLFDKDGKVTRSGRSLFGKLFNRWDRRKFLVEDCPIVLNVQGRGDSRKYCVCDPSLL
jgi:hypothetical protein